MRSVSDLLRTYNVVNTPEGRKYTTRFFAGLVALAVIGGGALLLSAGPAPTPDNGALSSAGEDDTPTDPDPLGNDEDDPLDDGLDDPFDGNITDGGSLPLSAAA